MRKEGSAIAERGRLNLLLDDYLCWSVMTGSIIEAAGAEIICHPADGTT